MSHIRQRTNYGIIAASILFIVSVLRVPVADGYFRPLFQLIMETGILLGFSLWVCTLNRWIGLFLILTIFSSIYPNFGKWSYMARNTIFIGAVWYVMIVKLKPNIRYLMDAICVAALLNLIFANFQYCGIDPYNIFTFGLMKSTWSHPVGLMANKNLLSALFAVSIPMFFRPYWKWFVPFIFYGLTIASSLGGAIAAFIMCLVYFIFKDGREGFSKNYVKLIFLLIWFIFFLTAIDSPVETEVNKGTETINIPLSANLRLDAWKKGLSLYITKHPIFGYGIGHWKLAFKKITPPDKPVMTKAHNEFIQGLFEMGILFPILILGYLINVIIRYRKEAILSVSALIAICLNSMVNFPFHIATTAILFITIMAIMEVQLETA
jgi:hypothetical protein